MTALSQAKIKWPIVRPLFLASIGISIGRLGSVISWEPDPTSHCWHESSGLCYVISQPQVAYMSTFINRSQRKSSPRIYEKLDGKLKLWRIVLKIA